MKHPARLLTLSTALVAGSIAHAVTRTDFNAYLAASPAPAVRTSSLSRPVVAPAMVLSTDEQRGVPTFLRADLGQMRAPQEARGSAEQAARWYLAHHAARYGVSNDALQAARILTVHDTGEGGIIVSLRQSVAGIDVFLNDVKVLLTRDLDLVAISGNPHPSAVPGRVSGRLAFRVASTDALAGAINDLYKVGATGSDMRDTGQTRNGYHFLSLASESRAGSAGLRLSRPARVKQVFFPMPDRIVPAWFVEVFSSRGSSASSDAYAFVVSAVDGRLLFRQNLTQDASFDYRVWADSDTRPHSGPHADYSPHPTGIPDGSNPAPTASSLITADGFNSASGGTGDPWLEAGATESVGNNVDAYTDLNSPDGLSTGDYRAATSSAGTFDWVYDLEQAPLSSTEQTHASLTQLFFTTNWLHDWYYDSGFDEAAGNAQLNNYGRGGIEADRMLVEGQDAALAGTRNNANMSTPYDGAAPRMQVYLWTGEIARSLEVHPLEGQLVTGTAAFGPQSFDLSADVVLANDGVSPNSNGCETILNDVVDKIVLVDRGTCTFKVKAVNVAAAGAAGMLIVNNSAGAAPPNMSDPDPSVIVDLPTLSITLEDGNRIKTLLGTEPVIADMFRETGPERDGGLDSSVVAHEWGHYLHNRLVTVGTQQSRAQGEGWGDFVGVHLGMSDGDDLRGTYAIAQYAGASIGDSGYYGIRRVPYSVDLTRNALTFRHIQDGEPLPTTTPMVNGGSANSEVHNAGEVWATMMWEAYNTLLAQSEGSTPRYTFDEARRLMSDYVVAGMMLAPAYPTFTEQRNALLAAVAAHDEHNAQLMAEAFATRGAGTCAISPPRESTDLKGVVESYELAPDLGEMSLKIDDAVESCDQDGFLDGDETGHVTLEIVNNGAAPLIGTEAAVSSSNPGVHFANNGLLVIDEIAPFSRVVRSLEVTMDDVFTDITYLDVSVTLSNSDACTSERTQTVQFRTNLDDVANASTTETVESESAVWTPMIADGPLETWSRIASSDTNHVFYGMDPTRLTDASLVSPVLEFAGEAPLGLSFQHSYQFETSPAETGGADVYWDGAVIELSEDAGATWTDISEYGNPGYNGTIGNLAGNPLMDRQAYVNTNPSWPESDTVSIELSPALAGKSVQIRFRIGADQAAGGEGWKIDNIALQGISNQPFSAVVPDATTLTEYYLDADGDGHGTPGQALMDCTAPEGYAASSDDCDDSNPSTYGGAPEACDGIDNDCGGDIDEDFDLDVDGYTTCGGDCDDANGDVHPGATDGRNGDGIDNDCDGSVDEGGGCSGSPTSGRTLGAFGSLLPAGLLGLLIRRRRSSL